MNVAGDVMIQLRGHALQRTRAPITLAASDAAGNRLEVHLSAVDSMSAAVREIRLTAATLAQPAHTPAAIPPFDVVRDWSSRIAARLTYLLETLAPLELDPQQGTVLVRSQQPVQKSHGTAYYELVVTARQDGSIVMSRFETIRGQPGRTQVDMNFTLDVMERLLEDLVDSLP